jgi:hypothetical protein
MLFIEMDKKKISSINQKDNTMNSIAELKLKITRLFGTINPKNHDGFLKKMQEYDLYSKLDLSEDSLKSIISKKKVGGSFRSIEELVKERELLNKRKLAREARALNRKKRLEAGEDAGLLKIREDEDKEQADSDNIRALEMNREFLEYTESKLAELERKKAVRDGHADSTNKEQIERDTKAELGDKTLKETYLRDKKQYEDVIAALKPIYTPGSPAYTPYSPTYGPNSPGYYGPPRSPTYGPNSPSFGRLGYPDYTPHSPTLASYLPPKSPINSDGESVFDPEELEMMEALADVNKAFLDGQLAAQENEYVETYAIPEGQTIYRRDEIVTELLEDFRNAGTSVIFSNEDKLKIWIDEMLSLVDNVSSKDIEGNITGLKEIRSDYKPVVENFENGKGTGVSWMVSVSNEQKKVYDAGNDGDYFFTADSKEELSRENKIIEADPNNTDPETKYRGYDNQQRILYGLSKPSRNSEELKGGNDGNHILDKEVYYVHTVEEDGTFVLGKRILDKGVHRIQNTYENISKKSGKKAEPKKQYETLGRKRLVDVEEVEIVEPEKISTGSFVITKPGGKKLKPVDGFYETQIINNPVHLNENIDPFRSTQEKYVLINQPICISDPYSLNKKTYPIMVDTNSLSVSNLKKGDKILLRITLPDTSGIYTNDIVNLLNSNIKVSHDESDIPNDLDILVSVSHYSLGYIREDGNYAFNNDESRGSEKYTKNSYCLLYVTPILGPPSVINKRWKQAFTTVRHPRIINVFKNNINDLKVGDNVVVFLTALLMDRIVNGKPIVPKDGSNPYYIATGIDKLEEGDYNMYYANVSILSIDDHTVTLKGVSGDIDKDAEIKLTLDDFSLIYISKNVEKAQKVIQTILFNHINFDNVTNLPITYVSNENYEGATSLVWGKVVGKYLPGKVSKTYSKLYHFLVQLLQPTRNNKVGDFILVEGNIDVDGNITSSKIVYEADKLVFEKGRIGDSSLSSWIKGIFTSTDVDKIVPTLQEFLNKITNKLRDKESIHYSFIQDLAKLALDYDKYEITEFTRNKIDRWIQWNLIKNVESMAQNYNSIRENYSALLELFEGGEELNPEKFRLSRTIDLTYTDYSNWSVDKKPKDYSDIRNIELVDEIKKTFGDNIALWSKVDTKSLGEHQLKLLSEKKVDVQKKWHKMISYKEEPKSRQSKLLDSIYKLQDPILRNKLLISFIEKDCYLADDALKGGKWYYSKIDINRVPLLCPHIYLELTSKSLGEYASEPLKDGTVVCKNCGGLLDTMVFSYFEGYEDNDKRSGSVQVVNGKEVIGTMQDTEIVIENKYIYSESENPNEYGLEVMFNQYASTLSSHIQDFIDKNRDIKASAIDDIYFYILQYNITDYNSWFSKNKDVLLEAVNKITKVQSKIDEIIRNKFSQYTSSRKSNITIARLVILVQKEVDERYRMTEDHAINEILKVHEGRRIAKGEKPSNIENTRKEVVKDFMNFTTSSIFPNISDLYAREESKYEPAELQIKYEEKFETYTESDINDNLSLFDALNWLKYYIRKIHKEEKVLGVVDVEECVSGIKEFKSYGTTETNSRIIEKLEEFIFNRMPNEDNRTGVKSRKQFYSSTELKEPVLGLNETNILEAKLIIKNLYEIQTNETLMKSTYTDKTVLEQKKAQLKQFIKEVMENLPKYKLVDYLVTYTTDTNTNKVGIRMYENGIDTESGINRSDLIARYLGMNIDELRKSVNKLKQTEIDIETFDISIKEEHLVKPKEDSLLSTLITKISDKLKSSITDKSYNVDKVIQVLSNMEKEFDTEKGSKVYIYKTLTDVKAKKVSLYKEYERLTKMLTYIKRDYNYLINGANIREKKAKLATQLDIKIKEGESLDTFETEYDYLLKYTDAEYYNELKQRCSSMNAEDVKLVEQLDCGDMDEIDCFVARNSRNKFLFCATILRILLQFNYNWTELNPDTYKKETTINNLDIDMEGNDDFTILLDRKVSEFIVDFINNINKIFRREEETFKGIEDYKERNFELVKQVERSKRMKHIDTVGSDLMKEFSKVMKGKRTLAITTKDASSDTPLEAVKAVDQEHYEVDPNGAGNYGTVFNNDLEGDGDDYNEEEAFDILD